MAQNHLSPIRTLGEYVERMDDGEFLCRRRRRHDWPSERMKIGQRLPDGIHTEHLPDGSYRVTEECLDCGKAVTWTTEKYGAMIVKKRRSYEPYAVIIPSQVVYKPSDLQAIHMEMVSAALFPEPPRVRRGGRGSSQSRDKGRKPAVVSSS